MDVILWVAALRPPPERGVVVTLATESNFQRQLRHATFADRPPERVEEAKEKEPSLVGTPLTSGDRAALRGADVDSGKAELEIMLDDLRLTQIAA